MSEPRRVSAAGGSFTKPSRRLCKARSESLASLSRTFVRRPDAAARRIRPRGHYTNKKQAKKLPIASSEKQRLRVTRRWEWSPIREYAADLVAGRELTIAQIAE